MSALNCQSTNVQTSEDSVVTYMYVYIYVYTYKMIRSR
jgi:hypothetical protein